MEGGMYSASFDVGAGLQMDNSDRDNLAVVDPCVEDLDGSLPDHRRGVEDIDSFHMGHDIPVAGAGDMLAWEDILGTVKVAA
jgi:hypothetical protein